MRENGNTGSRAGLITNKWYDKEEDSSTYFLSLYLKDQIDCIFFISAGRLFQSLVPLYLIALFQISDVATQWLELTY